MSLEKCACIDTLYTEIPFEKRFSAAAKDGFAAIEFWDWRNKNPQELKELAEAAGVAINGFNGDADYSLVDPTHFDKYLEYLRQSVDFACQCKASAVTIHSNALEKVDLWSTITMTSLIPSNFAQCTERWRNVLKLPKVPAYQ